MNELILNNCSAYESAVNYTDACSEKVVVILPDNGNRAFLNKDDALMLIDFLNKTFKLSEA